MKIKIKPNYFVVPLITIAVAAGGRYFTSLGMEDWYGELAKPAWTPSGAFIGAMWTFLYILVTAVVLGIVNRHRGVKNYNLIIGLFILNALLNATWSLIFFGMNLVGLALGWIILLNLTIIVLIVLIWPVSKLLASGLIPYTAWVSVAGALNYWIWIMN